MFSMAMWMVLVVAPLQIAIGDALGLNTLKHQPAKIAAIEGHWENRPGETVPLDPFRLARHGSRNDPLRRRDPLSRQPDPDP